MDLTLDLGTPQTPWLSKKAFTLIQPSCFATSEQAQSSGPNSKTQGSSALEQSSVLPFSKPLA